MILFILSFSLLFLSFSLLFYFFSPFLSLQTGTEENPYPISYIYFSDVPKKKLSDIHDLLFDVLKAVGKEGEEYNPKAREKGEKGKGEEEKEDEEEKKKEEEKGIFGIDMERMILVLDHEIRNFLSTIEEDPHETFASTAISDFLYGHLFERKEKSDEEEKKEGEEKGSSSRLKKLFSTNEVLKELKEEKEEYWINLVRKYFLPPSPVVCLIAEPSKEEADMLVKEEKERVEKQKEEIGEEKLKELGEKLKEAMEKNEVPVPVEVLESIPIPSPSSISLFPVVRISRDGIHRKIVKMKDEEEEKQEKKEDAEKWMLDLQHSLSSLPFFLQFDQIRSNFIEIRLLFDTSSFSPSLRPLLELYLDIIFDLPIYRKGESGEVTLIPHSQVVKELKALTVSSSNSGPLFSSLLLFSFYSSFLFSFSLFLFFLLLKILFFQLVLEDRPSFLLVLMDS